MLLTESSGAAGSLFNFCVLEIKGFSTCLIKTTVKKTPPDISIKVSLMVKKLHNDKSVKFLGLDWKGKAVHSTHCSVHPVIRIRLAPFDWPLKAK